MSQSATRQIAALKKKIPAQVATLNILSKAAGAAELVTVDQCYDGSLSLGSTADMAARRQFVTAHGALRRRTEQEDFLQRDASGLLAFFRTRQAALEVIRRAPEGEPATWPAGDARQVTYFPLSVSGAARDGLQSLAGAVACDMSSLHRDARRTLQGHQTFKGALAADEQQPKL